MTRIALAKKLFRFLQLNRVPVAKRTKDQKATLAALDAELGDDLDRVFKSVNLKPDALFKEEIEQAEVNE